MRFRHTCRRSPRPRSAAARPLGRADATARLPYRHSRWRGPRAAGSSGGGDRLELRSLDALHAGSAELEQAVELDAVERLPLGRPLHLDEAAPARHDDVEVDLGGRVLLVVEIEYGLPLDDPARDGGDTRGERQLAQLARVDQPAERAVQRDVAAADRCTARAAVGLQDVAVDPHGALAERLEVDDRAQRAADQALDLDRAAIRAAARGVALLPLAGRGRQHPVLRADPAAPGAAQ